LTLSTLPRTHSEEIVKTLVGDSTVSPALIRQIAERSDGIPLFVEELTKTILEAVPEARGSVTVTTAPSIPITLNDTLLARLDRLGTGRATAQLGAVLGREFTYEMLQAVGVFDEETLQQTLPKLVETELVYQRGSGAQARYTFKHALIQDAAYQSLLRRTRQQYHQQIVRALEERFPETKETQPELLAHHYAAAGLTEQAISYWQVAGQSAMTRSANAEAIRHLEAGLGLLTLLPETPERRQHELMLQMTLGTALMTTKGFAAPEVEKAYARARELCQQLGEIPQLIPVLWGLCAFHQVRVALPTALELAEQISRLAQQLHDPDCLAAAHYALGATHFWMGDFTLAQEHMEQSIALYEPQRHQSQVLTYGQDFGVTSRSYPIISLWLLGYPDQAQRLSHETLTLPQAASHPYSRLFALYASAILHCWLYQWTTGREMAQTITELATEHGLEFYRLIGAFLAHWADTAQLPPGHENTAIGQNVAVHKQFDAIVGRSCALSVQAYACLRASQIETGLEIIAEALAYIERTEERWYEAEVWRIYGELMLQKGDAERAEECFRKAIAIAQKQQAKSLELRATVCLARLWQQHGKQHDAHSVLSEIYHWFTEGFDTYDLQEAKALLTNMSRAAASTEGAFND
jgi:predicted ATPase